MTSASRWRSARSLARAIVDIYLLDGTAQSVSESQRNMSAEIKKEISAGDRAHVLFIDIVGYSKLSINEQRAVVDELTQVVRNSDQYGKAEAADRLIKIPTGDGIAS